MKTCYTREQIETSVKEKGYKWFEDNNNKGYDVNIVGVRNSETKGRVTNAFDDCITISYKIEGEWQFYCFPCTTDPGSHWVENILNEKGVAILKPNQYRGSHKLRLHQGKYLALGQKKEVTVYRDKIVMAIMIQTNLRQTQVYLELTYTEQQVEKEANLQEQTNGQQVVK